MGFHPGADLAAGLVETTGGVLVAAPVEVAEVVGEAEKETELLDAQVGTGEGRLPAPGVGGLDERFQHVERGALNAVAEKEALSTWKPVERGDQPEDEAVVEFDGGAGLAGTIAGALLRLRLLRKPGFRLAGRHPSSRSRG